MQPEEYTKELEESVMKLLEDIKSNHIDQEMSFIELASMFSVLLAGTLQSPLVADKEKFESIKKESDEVVDKLIEYGKKLEEEGYPYVVQLIGTSKYLSRLTVSFCMQLKEEGVI